MAQAIVPLDGQDQRLARAAFHPANKGIETVGGDLPQEEIAEHVVADRARKADLAAATPICARSTTRWTGWPPSRSSIGCGRYSITPGSATLSRPEAMMSHMNVPQDKTRFLTHYSSVL